MLVLEPSLYGWNLLLRPLLKLQLLLSFTRQPVPDVKKCI